MASPSTRETKRVFTDSQAARERVPLIIGLCGASGSGKTFSALRLATGIQRIAGGAIWGIDTEARRMLHYAPRKGEKANPATGTFDFRHLPFGAPFSPLDYLSAIEHCVKNGAKTIIVDSTSHEHEGPGGVLEMHQQEAERLAEAWKTSIDKTNIPAWGKPKAERRRLLNAILQMSCNFIFCFRAKEKIKVITGKNPQQLGWMPIAGEEFVYEMAMCALLYPGSCGVPSWAPTEMGEKTIVKLPEQFKDLLVTERRSLSEDIGQKLAEWAAGGAPPVGDPNAADGAAAAALTVTSVSDRVIKRGGKDETLYTVRTSDGRELGTFDKGVADLARSVAEAREPVVVTWTRSPRGGLLIETLSRAPEEGIPGADLFGDDIPPAPAEIADAGASAAAGR